MRTSPRLAELVNHIFGKPELACRKLLRETDEEVRNLRARVRAMKVHAAII
jgi:hypothetical protein